MSTASWLKKIDPSLFALDEKPQFGGPGAFPLESVAELLKQLFEKRALTLSLNERGWTDPNEIWDGLGENLLFLPIDLTPLQAPLYFAMSEQDIKELMGELLSGSSTLSPFYSKEQAVGFYHYLALEILQCIEQSGFAKPLSPRVAETGNNVRETLSAERCFAVDVHCDLNEKTIWGRLLIPVAFRQQWKEHFATSEMESTIDPHLPIEIGLQIGRSEVMAAELKRVRVGDILLLDNCSFDLERGRGGATVVLGEMPIFHGKFKENALELSEMPFEELGEDMSEDEFDEDMDEELSDEEFEGEDQEFENDELEAEEPEQHPSGSGIDVSHLPVNVTVEVARLKMTMQELSQLTPGNLLELSQSPGAGVSLLVNGSRIGRGELVQIGETVGVRIVTI